ncbi:MAG: hypothetical protein QOH79_104 [Acidimicrobiaceae bacterium]
MRVTAALIAFTMLGSFAALSAQSEAKATSVATRKLTAGPVAKPTTTLPPPTEPSTTEVPTTEVPTTEPPPPPAPAPAPLLASTVEPGPPLAAPGAFTLDPYAGLGTWIDVYDWSETYGGGAVGIADIDRMASLGVQTVYVQATRWDAETPVLEPERLIALMKRARADGMRVVAWYLPDLGDPNDDMQRLAAIAALPIDGLAIDIESRKVSDVNERNQRLLSLSAALRQRLPGQVLSAIVLPPVVMEDVNPNYWPDYPWAGLAQYYDVWQPMSYWTNRLPEWRDAYLYTATNIDRIREHIGNPNAIVHTIGGIGDASTPDDVAGMANAASDRGCIGAGLYDYRTTGDDLWAGLQSLRA